MLFRGSGLKLIALILGLLCLAGCNDSDERKTHYVTIYLSQDVEIKETLVDLDMKKPGVVVVHPEGVDVKHWPTKPKKTVSFEAPPAGLLMALLLILLAVTSLLARPSDPVLRAP